MILQHALTVIILWFLFILLMEIFFSNYTIIISNNTNLLNRRKVINIFMGIINQLLLPLLTVPILIFVTQLGPWHRHIHSHLILSILTLLDVFALDLVSYFFHRLCHVVRFFWKFHEIHHLDEALDATTGLRIHFGEAFFATLFRIPLILIFSMPIQSVAIFGLVLIANGIFHHSNIKLKPYANKLLSLVLVTPRWHYIHHHATPEDMNSNYGFIFIWWDFIFNTINKKHRSEDWVLGLKYSKDKSFIKLICYPFTNKYLRDI